MSNSSKIEKYLEVDELPDFLRDLANAIENGDTGEFACAEDFKRFKLAAKNEFGKISVRAKFKSARECGPPPELLVDAETGEPVKPRYSHLKKRMKSSFRMITGMVHEGVIPPEEAMGSFLADSALMVTYPGYGDEYYDEYIAACDELKAAFDAKDVARLKASVVELAKQKGRCHAKYD